MFTYDELIMLSQSLIGAIERCNQAKQLVNSPDTIYAIDNECTKLQELNVKVCELTSRA